MREFIQIQLFISYSDSLSKTKTFKHRPKPRYVKPMVETFPRGMSPQPDFNSTTSIKDAIYIEWFKEKQERAKKELKEKKQKEKEEEERKAKVQ